MYTAVVLLVHVPLHGIPQYPIAYIMKYTQVQRYWLLFGSIAIFLVEKLKLRIKCAALVELLNVACIVLPVLLRAFNAPYAPLLAHSMWSDLWMFCLIQKLPLTFVGYLVVDAYATSSTESNGATHSHWR